MTKNEIKMSAEEIDREIRKTLRDILSYTGGALKDSDNATLRSYLEYLIKTVTL